MYQAESNTHGRNENVTTRYISGNRKSSSQPYVVLRKYGDMFYIMVSLHKG